MLNQIATFHGSRAYRRSSLSRPGLSDGIFIEKHGQWYVAYIEEIPGVNTQGRTLVATRCNLGEALRLVVRANRELAEKKSGAMGEPIIVNL